MSSRPLFFLMYHVDFHCRWKNLSENYGFYYHGYIAAELGPQFHFQQSEGYHRVAEFRCGTGEWE